MAEIFSLYFPGNQLSKQFACHVDSEAQANMFHLCSNADLVKEMRKFERLFSQ
jgi:hypothetical protein